MSLTIIKQDLLFLYKNAINFFSRAYITMQWQIWRQRENSLMQPEAFSHGQTGLCSHKLRVCFAVCPSLAQLMAPILFPVETGRIQNPSAFFGLLCCWCLSLAQTYWSFLVKLLNCCLHVRGVYNGQNLASSCYHGLVHIKFSSLAL